MQKTIYLVRHGQTTGNTEGNWLGSRSIDTLNEYGRKQARFTVEFLVQKGIRAYKIFASPTPRALQHAEILQKSLNLPIEKFHSLTEMNLGILEDRTREQGLRLAPEEIYDWKNNLSQFHPPLGESALEAVERFYEIVELIAKNYQGKDILIVAHGIVIKLFLARIMKAGIETGEKDIKVPQTNHGSIAVVKYDGGHFAYREVVENEYPDSLETIAFG